MVIASTQTPSLYSPTTSGETFFLSTMFWNSSIKKYTRRAYINFSSGELSDTLKQDIGEINEQYSDIAVLGAARIFKIEAQEPRELEGPWKSEGGLLRQYGTYFQNVKVPEQTIVLGSAFPQGVRLHCLGEGFKGVHRFKY